MANLAAAAATGSSIRSYYWPYAEDFVPKGERTSAFQSSASPSKRRDVIDGFVDFPYFGERRVVCTIGFRTRPTLHDDSSCADSSSLLTIPTIMSAKRPLRELFASFFDTSVSNIHLGSLQQTRRMMLYRQDASSPRLGDGPRAIPSRSGSEEEEGASLSINNSSGHGNDPRIRTRREHYCRASISADVLVDLSFDEASDVDVEDAKVYGALFQSYFHEMHAAGQPSSLLMGSKEAAAAAHERCLRCVSEMRELGVVYCELPTDDPLSEWAWERSS